MLRRAHRLDAVVTALMSAAEGDRALEAALVADPQDPAFVAALHALVHCWRGEFEAGSTAARSAVSAADDPVAALFARAMAGYAIAAWPRAVEEFDDPFAAPFEAPRDEPGDGSGALLVLLLAEAALACARIDDARRIAAAVELPEALFGRHDHPFLTFLRCTVLRILAFAGDLAGATALARPAIDGATAPIARAFALACEVLVAGNADRRTEIRRSLELLEQTAVAPSNLVTSGVLLLASYGAIAQGDVQRSVALALRAGGDASLSRLRIVDRAICIELLAHAAVDEGDLDAANDWLSEVEELAEHPIADSTVARIRSRATLLEGDAAAALRHAEHSIALARRHGRGIEAAEGEVLAARARIALRLPGDAERRLIGVVAEADERGFRAIRRSAARELRRTGRRLPPSPGWLGLSEREQQVARLMAGGLGNAAIAERLHLSAHTVRAHVTRVLHALGVASRAGVAAALPLDPGASPAASALRRPAERARLSPRQQEVARLVARGASNRAIAAELGIGEFTVEKHVAEILRRLELPSRSAVGGVAEFRETNTPL